ncbi:ABC-type transporter Mla subunit MlaD [Bradyrhizobium sp. JR1.7]|uniref:hypothetical protein n=1 Tax=unclassified Bradyrhizobium TaxID=2631580 RepID=UPI003391C831
MTVEAEVHQMIGGLKATVDHLNTTVRDLMTMWSTQEKNASEGRRILHEKVDALKDSAQELTNRVSSIETTLVDIKPAVEEFESQRDQQKGALKLGKIIYAALTAAAGAAGWGLAHFFGSAPLPPPGH